MERFKNQTAIITGSARGIGKGIAKRLGSEGANITLVDMNSNETQSTLEEKIRKEIAPERKGAKDGKGGRQVGGSERINKINKAN